MKKRTSLLIAACSLLLLPLAGCSASDSGVADGGGEGSTPSDSAVDDNAATDNSTAPEDSIDLYEPLTVKLTAANKDGNAEVTIMAPESWYSWGPGDIVKRGAIVNTQTNTDNPWLFAEVIDGWPQGCTPQNLATQICELYASRHLDYKPLEPITIGEYNAAGFEFIEDLDTYQIKAQHHLLDIDGAQIMFRIAVTEVDEEFPQILLDIRDSLTVELVG